ncbi:MAG TPA: hypothetical protein VHE37_00295 [Nevskiaceae bacterium]|nr:hypothetical protein [Nevskiaceae bacterium]
MHGATRVLIALLLSLGTYGGTALADAGGLAGQVTLMTGRGTASAADGAVRSLTTGDSVYSGEVISSGANSYVSLKFVDGGLVLLRPRTRFEIQDYSYTPPATAAPMAATPTPIAPGTIGGAKPAIPAAPSVAAPPAQASSGDEGNGTTRAFFRLLKGSFRAVSGLIGKANQDDYRVSTPVATIGIRGTDYFALIIDAAYAKDPVLKSSLPPGISSEGGLYVEQYEGSTVVTNNAGQQTVVSMGQHLVTLGNGQQLHVKQPKLLTSDPPPDPKQMKCNH